MIFSRIQVFANKRANRIKVLVHDGVGLWLATRRLHQGSFHWHQGAAQRLELNPAQLQALVLGLPWQSMQDAGVIQLV